MKTLSIPIAAGKTVEVPGGDLFYLLATSNGVDVQYINHAGTPLNESAVAVESGYWSKPKDGFNMARITSATTQTIKVGISRGDGGYDRVTGEVTTSKGANLATVDDIALTAGVATVIVAADLNRREILITNLPTNANAIRVGDSNVAAARGVYVAVGAVISLETSAAVYGFSPAADVVALTEVKD